jgi:hypothetical protein
MEAKLMIKMKVYRELSVLCTGPNFLSMTALHNFGKRTSAIQFVANSLGRPLAGIKPVCYFFLI